MNEHSVLIKRYPNRKLYNTETSKYINLRQIAEMVESGGAVTIIDNRSGEDLTRMMLAQIMVEKEKQARRTPTSEFWQRFFPLRAGQFNELIDKVKRAAGPERLISVQEDMERQIQKWVSRGQVTRDEVRSYMEQVQKNVENIGHITEETVTGFWEKLISRNDNEHDLLASLVEKISSLESRIKVLENRHSTGKK